MEVIVSSIVSIRGIDPAFKEELRKRYTFTPLLPRGTPHYVKPVSVSLCSTFQNFFNVPRSIALLQELGSAAKIIDAQDTPHLPRPTPRFRGTLDPKRNQVDAVNQCLTMLQKTSYGGGCLLSLPPGFGKTACALYISTKLPAKRTLILVHTKILALQWKDRVESFLENATVVLVNAQTPVDIDKLTHATHVIMLLQTVVALTKKGSVEWLRNLHDLILVDECHHIVAKTLCKVVETVGSRYRLGLSATLQRKDGLDDMLECLVGPIAYACERQTCPGLIVHVKFFQTKYLTKATTFVQHLNEIAQDCVRQKLILQTIRDLYSQGRYIIVLSDRLQMLDTIAKALNDVTINIPIHMSIGGNTTDPDMTLRPVILATYQFASEGLDIVELNTCVLATPRIEPVVVDIVDEDRPMIKRQFSKRKQFYTKPLADGGLNATLRFFQ
jgi:superfamily II DNA or RNA helicase